MYQWSWYWYLFLFSKPTASGWFTLPASTEDTALFRQTLWHYKKENWNFVQNPGFPFNSTILQACWRACRACSCCSGHCHCCQKDHHHHHHFHHHHRHCHHYRSNDQVNVPIGLQESVSLMVNQVKFLSSVNHFLIARSILFDGTNICKLLSKYVFLLCLTNDYQPHERCLMIIISIYIGIGFWFCFSFGCIAWWESPSYIGTWLIWSYFVFLV